LRKLMIYKEETIYGWLEFCVLGRWATIFG
jgi:hypothetical protein